VPGIPTGLDAAGEVAAPFAPVVAGTFIITEYIGPK
jgi:hypothetical protein